MQLSIVTISAFVALLNQGTKYVATNFIKRDISKWIPVLSVIYGIALGIIGFYCCGNMGNDIVEAIFIGVSAGSASTGIHQIYKQLYGKSDTDPPTTEDTTEDSGEIIIPANSSESEVESEDNK